MLLLYFLKLMDKRKENQMSRIDVLETMLTMYKKAKKNTDDPKEKQHYNQDICAIRKELKKISKCKY